MNIAEADSKYAAERVITETKALPKRMAENSREFTGKGASLDVTTSIHF